MAVSANRFPVPSWINANNALSAYNGLHINSPWEGWVKSINRPDRKPISDELRAVWIITMTNYCLFTAFSHIESILSPERVTVNGWELIPNLRGPYFYAALVLTAVSAMKVYKEFELNQPPPLEADALPSKSKAHQPKLEFTTFDKCIVMASNATPYLMIITNIAVTIIQIRSGNSSAWVKLGFISITLIDITSFKPENYVWFLNTVLDYPVKAAAFYYGDRNFRLNILFNLAIRTQTVNEWIIQPLQARIIKILNGNDDDTVGIDAQTGKKD